MKIKRDTEFSSFSDGVCDVYTLDEDGARADKYTGLGYEERVMGYKRHFAAAAAQVRVDAVIRVPLVPGIDPRDTVALRSGGCFEVELVQTIRDCNPPALDLTLRKLEMHGVGQ